MMIRPTEVEIFRLVVLYLGQVKKHTGPYIPHNATSLSLDLKVKAASAL